MQPHQTAHAPPTPPSFNGRRRHSSKCGTKRTPASRVQHRRNGHWPLQRCTAGCNSTKHRKPFTAILPENSKRSSDNQRPTHVTARKNHGQRSLQMARDMAGRTYCDQRGAKYGARQDGADIAPSSGHRHADQCARSEPPLRQQVGLVTKEHGETNGTVRRRRKDPQLR